MKDIKTLPFQVSAKIVALAEADTMLHKRFKAELEASHVRLWEAVHAEYPELDEDGGYQLDCSYAEQGVVMLKTHEKKSGVSEMLHRMMKDIN